jgi:putative sterol carrier protein
MALLFDSVRRAVDPRTAPAGPMTLQWEFPDAEPWHLRLDNGSTAAVPGRAPDPDVELKVAFDDWVDVIAGRLDPKRAVATRRLRLKGSPRSLWRARGVFAA